MFNSLCHINLSFSLFSYFILVYLFCFFMVIPVTIYLPYSVQSPLSIIA